MSSAATPLPRLPQHGLAGPTGDDALRLLSHAAHADHRIVQRVWAEVCEASGLSTGVHLLTVAQAEALAEAMVAQPAAVGVAGRDFRIRVRSYALLAVQEAASDAAPRSFDPGYRSAAELVRSRMPDDRRIAAIAALDLFSEANQAILDTAARRAAEHLGTPVGMATLVTEGAQSYVGSHQLEGWSAAAGGTPVEWAFCATTVRRREPYVVTDATVDVHQRSNPLVQLGTTVSYAAVPLTTSDAHVLAALCALGPTPLTPPPHQLEGPASIRAEAPAQVEAGRAAVRTPPAP